MLRPRRRRSSSTNSDTRVAALIAASLIRGGSLLAVAPDCGKRESSVVLRGIERRAWMMSCGGIRLEKTSVDESLAVVKLLLQIGEYDGEPERLVTMREESSNEALKHDG
eukprot:4073205-Pleurochrysis_carterae.AAC.1